ncbi:MAG: type I glutamate--ammonia ligase, partial [Eubacteriales bacterium]|nr:type I glutamate--ammonia ligase [Eubacteriales bacterium]
DNGNATTVSHENAGYLDVGPVDFGENARRDMVLTLEEMGFEIESSYHEEAPAQHEIDFTQGEALETADALMTFKFALRSIAKRFGMYATFMPKPKMDLPGSGLHLNISMYKDGKNLFDADDNKIVTEDAKHFIGGILSHTEGMCAITNPIVNSYKRLLTSPGVTRDIKWSTKSNKCAVRMRRIFGESKVEVRFPDPSANPYLAIALCIASGLDGMHRQIDPDEWCSNHKKILPGNLKDALRRFKEDSYLFEVLGKGFCDSYIDIKTQEWDDYMIQVSDWEISRYLNKM